MVHMWDIAHTVVDREHCSRLESEMLLDGKPRMLNTTFERHFVCEPLVAVVVNETSNHVHLHTSNEQW